MRLTLLALVGAVCIACSFAHPLEEQAEKNDLYNVADLGQGHANEDGRQARFLLGGGLGGWGGGWGGGGWRGGWGGGGWGGGYRGGWGGGWLG